VLNVCGGGITESIPDLDCCVIVSLLHSDFVADRGQKAMHTAKLTLEILVGYFAVSFLGGGAWIALAKLNGGRAFEFPRAFASRVARTVTVLPPIQYLPRLDPE
jgi:hypothetical protein